MSLATLWGLLKKSQTDDTLIDDEIDSKISDHNDDESAHLGETGSLQSHKAAEIIDHVAESVVNDKIKYDSRAYNAVVAASGGDYTNIQDAIDYVYGQGGGIVLISAGTYALTADLVLRSNVDLEGYGQNRSLINCNGHAIVTSATLDEADPRWEDGTDNVSMKYIGVYGGKHQMLKAQCSGVFSFCKFYNGLGTIIVDLGGGNVFENNLIIQTLAWFNTNHAQDYWGIDGREGVSSKHINNTIQYCPKSLGVGEDAIVEGNKIYTCETGIWIEYPGAVVDGNNLSNCLDYGIYVNANEEVISANFIMGDERAGHYSAHDGIYVYYTTNQGYDTIITGNKIYQFVNGIHFATSTTKNLAVGNNCRLNSTNGVLDSGTANTVANNITS